MPYILTYVKRSLTEPYDGARTDGKAIVEAITTPGGHGTHRKSLFDRWRKSQTNQEKFVIWLVSLLKVPDGFMFPSLDARIAVKSAHRQDEENPAREQDYAAYLLRQYSYAFVADPANSSYFPLNDARPLLSKIRFDSKNAPRIPEVDLAEDRLNRLPLRIWTPRVIRSAFEPYMDESAYSLKSGPTVFISYRWSEATEHACVAARALTQAGISAWWDRWSMPRSVVENNAEIAASDIQTAIDNGFEGCRYGLILRSRSYDNSRWTRSEGKYLAENAHTFTIDLTRNGDAGEIERRVEQIASQILAIENGR